MDKKLKSENMQKRAVFYVYVIFCEQSGQAGVENSAMLTTYFFRYTSECIDPLTKILRTFLVQQVKVQGHGRKSTAQ